MLILSWVKYSYASYNTPSQKPMSYNNIGVGRDRNESMQRKVESYLNRSPIAAANPPIR